MPPLRLFLAHQIYVRGRKPVRSDCSTTRGVEHTGEGDDDSAYDHAGMQCGRLT